MAIKDVNMSGCEKADGGDRVRVTMTPDQFKDLRDCIVLAYQNANEESRMWSITTRIRNDIDRLSCELGSDFLDGKTGEDKREIGSNWSVDDDIFGDEMLNVVTMQLQRLRRTSRRKEMAIKDVKEVGNDWSDDYYDIGGDERLNVVVRQLLMEMMRDAPGLIEDLKKEIEQSMSSSSNTKETRGDDGETDQRSDLT